VYEKRQLQNFWILLCFPSAHTRLDGILHPAIASKLVKSPWCCGIIRFFYGENPWIFGQHKTVSLLTNFPISHEKSWSCNSTYFHWYSPCIYGITDMGLSENRVYSQWNSHLIGIMIMKTIGLIGVHNIFRHTHINHWFVSLKFHLFFTMSSPRWSNPPGQRAHAQPFRAWGPRGPSVCVRWEHGDSWQLLWKT